MKVKAGSTNVSVYYYIVQDASATSPGEPVTGLLFSDIETGGSASYVRQGAARTDLTLITLASASAAHSDGGFILVDDTNMPGVYRCDYPDAAFTAGVDQTILSIVVAAANNAVAAPISVDIDGNIDQTGDNYARLGAPAGASVSADIAKVPKSDGTVTWNSTALASVNAECDTSLTDMFTSSAQLVDDIYDESLAAHQTALTAGRAITLGGVPIAETTATGTPTTTSIQLTAGSTVDGAYEDHTLVILSGVATGETSPIKTYTGATRTCVFETIDAFTSAPSSGDVVIVKIDHVHPVSEIVNGMLDEATAGHVTAGTVGKAIVDTLADTGTDGVAISAATANQIADAILNRDFSSVSDTNARTALNALRFLRNKYSVAGSTLTVTKEDDSTSAWTSALTTDAAADPVTGSDPA